MAWNKYSDEPRPMDCHEHEPVRMVLTDVATPKEDATPEFIADCEAYFSQFVRPVHRDNKPENEMVCFHCGEPLTGMMAFMMARGGGFQWGIAHGEGFCGNCRWPARAYHFAKKADGTDLFTVRNLVLQYHPEYVGAREAA